MYEKSKTDWVEVALLTVLVLAIAAFFAMCFMFIFVEAEYTQTARCSETPYWQIRKERVIFYDPVGTVRMTDEEAVQECSK